MVSSGHQHPAPTVVPPVFPPNPTTFGSCGYRDAASKTPSLICCVCPGALHLGLWQGGGAAW